MTTIDEIKARLAGRTLREWESQAFRRDVEWLLAELATARADLARVAGELAEMRKNGGFWGRAAARLIEQRDAAIARAEAAERERDVCSEALRVAQEDIRLRVIEYQEMRSVAESRPAITADEASLFVSSDYPLMDNATSIRVFDALRAHAAKVPR